MRFPHTLALLALALALPGRAAAGDLVGPETCKACHPGAYAAWREGPHARALESLPERSRGDQRCLSCHAPAAEAGQAGVGCEACHGPGRAYAARYVMRDAELARALGLVVGGERACLGCHTETTPGLRRFDYQQKVKLIAHPDRPGGSAAAAAQPPPQPRTR
ncbi:MAG: hypothetical protein IPO09_19785 [Anaeromyxobacter sp.]|nr:hypothetical protein [Anaeromyxobacter sp.]MBL0274969.1 hypothetical protein [Anaeromyxobacter sp.]